MVRRTSIEIEGFNHGGAPIPAAARVGRLIVTGGIHGMDPTTETIPDAVEDQARLMFANLERVLAAAGASLDDVARMTIFINSPEGRSAVNTEWLKRFPNAEHRPARHTLHYDHFSANVAVQCDAIAMVAG